MKAGIKAAAFLIAAFAASGCASNGLYSKDSGFKVTEGFSSPESVAVDPTGKRYFVSNVGAKLEPSAKDGDGFISELDGNGAVTALRFLPKDGTLNAPKGMAVVGPTLYVADIDVVVGFDINTRQKVYELDFSAEKTAFLNDIAVLDASTLAVSATDIGKVFKVNIKDKPSYSVLADNIIGPNGLAFDAAGGNLYVVCFGEGFKGNGNIGVIRLKDEKPRFEPYTNAVGGLDGLAILGEGKLLFSDWVAFDRPGRLAVYDIYKRSITDVKLARDARGPADFHYDPVTGTIWLPGMMEGVVIIEKVKRP